MRAEKNSARISFARKSIAAGKTTCRERLFFLPLHQLVQRDAENIRQFAERVNVGRAVSVFIIGNQALFSAQQGRQFALCQVHLIAVKFYVFRYFGFHILDKCTKFLYHMMNCQTKCNT